MEQIWRSLGTGNHDTLERYCECTVVFLKHATGKGQLWVVQRQYQKKLDRLILKTNEKIPGQFRFLFRSIKTK